MVAAGHDFRGLAAPPREVACLRFSVIISCMQDFLCMMNRG